ncbi:MAG: VCBS repeat-containing protein, partial [Candidatus Aminicenantes bacterium]|nr:VCBS repeat-containing protein [Candidatus Aminicenantes bacterium]
MNKQKKAAGRFFPVFLLLIIAGILGLKFWAQEACVEHPLEFAESFNNTAFKDEDNSSVAHWSDGPPPDLPGYITLNKIGATFDIANPDSFPAWINTVTTGDFDNDGWPDFIGSSSSYSNALVFVRNLGAIGLIGSFGIMDDPDHYGRIDGTVCPFYPASLETDVPTQGVKGAVIDGSGHCGMTSGDYDGDGDLDFLFMVSRDVSPDFTFKRIWLYENRWMDSGETTLSFVQVDKTAAWSATLRGIAWSATMLTTLDFDNDGDPDILMGNRAGEVIKINNRNRTRAIGHNNKWNFTTVLTGAQTGWTSSRGISTLSIADFDFDTDLDIVIGSVGYPELKYWKNDGSGNFGTNPYAVYTDGSGDTHNDEYDGAASVSIACDFDRDGDADIVIGTDNWNYKPGAENIGGMCYYFRNAGGEFTPRLIYDNRPTVFDFDLGAYFDYDQDGDEDFLMADGNHARDYYIFINNIADVYNLQGIAQSANITPALDPNLHAITKIRIANVIQSVVGGSNEGLAVTYYVSNNDGRDWELYATCAESEIRDFGILPDTLSGDWHTFEHYGSRLKWRAVFEAEDDNIPGFPDASYETPRIDNIEFEIIYVDRKEYSRTSVAATVADNSGAPIKLIIGGTFIFPGWEGHLFAYDVTNMSPLNTSYSELRTVSRSDLSDPTGREIVAPGTVILWDAGALLAARSAADRRIYTTLPNAEGTALDRVDFTVANVTALEPYLDDVQGDHAGLIDFVRGEGRDWKLGDINHSNPVVVGPPNEVSSQMGAGYDAFKLTWEDRRKVLYVGANAGMIHSFDVLTGQELWGFIPYNLLPKLKNMWAVDQSTLGRYFERDIYVDGSPAVADVYIGGVWKTILVCGQGPGTGSVIGGGVNYYFALDVTDPENPQPLWELTADTMGETWSVPAIGKVTKDGGDAWVAFIGSGYDNNPDPGAVLGNVFYAVDLADGSILWTFEADEVDTSDPARSNAQFPNIQNTLPGSPSHVDINRDGYVDRV